MKKFRICILFPFVFIQLTFFNVSFCQSISKVSEIYNYEINDVFHLEEYGSAPGSGFSKYYNIQITNKYFSLDNDTLFYIRDIKTAISTNIHPPLVYEAYTDTVYYNNLDSLINTGHIDTVFYSSSYNGRKENTALDTTEWDSNSYGFIDGCGGPYYDYLNNDSFVHHYLKLIYFMKGTETWGTPYYVSINEIKTNEQNISIFPNPAHDKITIAINGAISRETYVSIFNLQGKKIINTRFQNQNTMQLDVNALAKGIYIVKVQRESGVENKKLIIK